MGILASLNEAASGSAFVVSGGQPGTLQLQTDDGSTQTVQVRAAGASAALITLSTATVSVAPGGTSVDVGTTGESAALGDCVIEMLIGGAVVATYSFTSIAKPEIQYEGRFQCRLASDPDGFDHPWGVASSFGMYAVQGPNPAAPYEPPLDRTVRFQNPVALRTLCPPVGVFVKRIRGLLANGSVVTFEAGDPIIGVKVELGPACKFDAQDGAVAAPGFEPISDFQIAIGSAFSGGTDPGLPRPNPASPPPTNAPYADGFFRMDQFGRVKPADFNYAEPNWTTRATAIPTQKLADLGVQLAATPQEVAIRDRRMLEHTNNFSGIAFTLRMMERYTGVIDKNLAITPGSSPTLQAFQSLTKFSYYGEFFDFDSDCQCGTVWGLIGII